MLPTSASTSRSWTSSPKRAADERADRVAVGPAAGQQRLERGARLPRHDSSRLVGQPRRCRPARRAAARRGSGAGRRATPPRARRSATSASSPSPTSRASAVPCGHPGEERVGALVDRRRARRTATCGACRRARSVGLADARSAASSRRRRRRRGRGRRSSPVIPPPTTTTAASSALDRRAMTRSASAPMHGRVVVHRRRAGERQPGRVGPPAGLDVEVVQHLEVVGDEAARAHEQPVGVLGAGQLVDRRRGCRARSTARASGRPTATRPTTATIGASPAAAATAVGGRRAARRGRGRRRRGSARAASGR